MSHPLLKGLSEVQAAAVTHRGGPLILLAGPGTGKTHVMTRRIAHIIQEFGAAPSSVLAVTFTIKAAAELRQRVGSLIPAPQAAQVNIHTFNGFGARLIERFAPYIGLPIRRQMIDLIQSRRLLKELILANNLFQDRRGEGLTALAKQCLTNMERFANLGAAPEDCIKAAKSWELRLAQTNPQENPEAFDEQVASHREFAQNAQLYQEYCNTRIAKGWIDYSDQITLPIQLLRNHHGPRSLVRGVYRWIIVDEFQDCNPGQIELLRLVAGPLTGQSTSTPPEVCVVGDDDQSIYGFRGSDDRAFQRFERYWTTPAYTPRILTLSENYRSQPQIIQAANTTISHAFSRFRSDKQIEFPRSKVPTGGRVEGVALSKDTEDGDPIAALLLTAQAQALRDQGADSPPFDWSNFAVIARGHTDLARISAALTLYDIPFDRAQDRSILSEDGVQDVLAWIEWLIDPRASWAARRIMMRPPYGIENTPIIDLERGYRAAAERAKQKFEGASHPGDYTKFIQGRLEELDSKTSTILKLVLEKYAALKATTASMRGDDAVFEIIRSCNIAHAELLDSRARHRRITAILAMISIAREKQDRLDQPKNLAQFWEYFSEAEKPEELLPKIDDDESELSEAAAEAASVQHTTQDGTAARIQGRVQLLTAHSSKGLEFDTVILPRINSPHGYPKTKRDDEPLQVPPDLFDSLDARGPDEKLYDEERRLFYVASTRAKRRLILLSRYNPKAKKPSQAAVKFFEELLPVPSDTPCGIEVLYSPQELLDKANELGAGPRNWGGAGPESSGSTPQENIEAVKETIQRIRTSSRLRIAAALEEAESITLNPARLPELQTTINEALESLAVTGWMQHNPSVPTWINSLSAQHDSQRLARLLSGITTASGTKYPFKKVPAPLRLSYTSLSDFLRCPRCWYVKYILNIPQRDSLEAHVGSLSHSVLEDFYRKWQLAEADGQTRPKLDDLLSEARAQYEREYSADSTPNVERLDQLLHQMRNAFERLHNETDHILELEKSYTFDYVDPVTNNPLAVITAKLDRVDQLPDGGIRVIDYKTGNATKEKLEPKPDDLQMGIYYLALKHAYNVPSLPGRAEYWNLATGQRGILDFSTIKQEKVLKQIQGVVEAIISGAFDVPGKKCNGECSLLGYPAPDPSSDSED